MGSDDAVSEVHRLQVIEPSDDTCRALAACLPGGQACTFAGGELAIQHVDLILADRPMPAGTYVKDYSHKLGDCVSHFSPSPRLAAQFTDKWPHIRNAAPLLIPGNEAAIRTPLIRWFDVHQIRPHIVGEFDDNALMQAFGQAGTGIFIAPSMIADEVQREHGVIILGQTDEITEQFYAISLEHRLTHPAVVAINNTAQRELFANLYTHERRWVNPL